MISTAKEKLKAGFTKFCMIFTICAFVGLPLGVAGLKAAGVRGNIEFPSIAIGGGTEEHAAREQQLAALSAALPASAMTPLPVRTPATSAEGPLPARKPEQR